MYSVVSMIWGSIHHSSEQQSPTGTYATRSVAPNAWNVHCLLRRENCRSTAWLILILISIFYILIQRNYICGVISYSKVIQIRQSTLVYMEKKTNIEQNCSVYRKSYGLFSWNLTIYMKNRIINSIGSDWKSWPTWTDYHGVIIKEYKMMGLNLYALYRSSIFVPQNYHHQNYRQQTTTKLQPPNHHQTTTKPSPHSH